MNEAVRYGVSGGPGVLVVAAVLSSACSRSLPPTSAPLARTSPDATRACPPDVPPAEGSATAQALSPAERVLYLTRLLAAARYRGDLQSKTALAAALGYSSVASLRGETATRALLGRLRDEAAAAGAKGVRALLGVALDELDGTATPASAADARRALGAGADNAVAALALLDLYASCATALFDAVAQPASRRAAIANHCLDAALPKVQASDVVASASARPPDLSWHRIFRWLERTLADLRRRDPCLDSLAQELARRVAALEERAEREGLMPPDLDVLGPKLVSLTTAQAPALSLPSYDRSPWLIVEDDLVVLGAARFTLRDHELTRQVERYLGGDPVHRLTLFLHGKSSGDAIDVLAAVARRLGVTTLELALSTPVAPSTAPEGRAEMRDASLRPAFRAVVVPIDLVASHRRDQPRAVVAETLPIVLIVRPEGMTLRARDGEIQLAHRELPSWLHTLSRSFPDSAAVRWAIDPTAPYRDVLQAVLVLRSRFHQILLVDVPEIPKSSGLRDRILRRARGRAILRDNTGHAVADPGSEWLRGCYLDALEERPALALRLPVPLASAALRDEPGLRRCLDERLSALGISEGEHLELILEPQ